MTRTLRTLAALLALACMTGVNAQTPEASAPTASTADLDALRSRLPADWSLQRVREPVFSSQIVTLEGGPSNAPLMLFVHGLGDGGMTDWLPTMRTMSERYRVLALDLPGFGRSESPFGKYSPTHYAEVLSWLVSRSGRTSAIVIGHSMGGAVSLRFANAHPEQVSRLILVDAAGILHRTAFVKHSATLPLSVDATPEALKPSIASLRNFGGVLVEKVLGVPLDPTELLRRSDLAWSVLLRSRSNVNAAMGMIDENFSQAVLPDPHPHLDHLGRSRPGHPAAHRPDARRPPAACQPGQHSRRHALADAVSHLAIHALAGTRPQRTGQRRAGHHQGARTKQQARHPALQRRDRQALHRHLARDHHRWLQCRAPR
ncbi:MAG: alpha/beta fold hydrolase [Rhodocyclaceae bacterium]